MYVPKVVCFHLLLEWFRRSHSHLKVDITTAIAIANTMIAYLFVSWVGYTRKQDQRIYSNFEIVAQGYLSLNFVSDRKVIVLALENPTIGRLSSPNSRVLGFRVQDMGRKEN